MKNILKIFAAGVGIASALACSNCNSLTSAEKELINNSDSLMRVLQVTEEKDLQVLRAQSVDLSLEDLTSQEYETLAAKMLVTVNDPEKPGVGIAAPQVGLNRRVVAVQRFDKEGEPFEVYANIYFEPVGEETQTGPEGCLSVPNRREMVTRYQTIEIRYTDSRSLEQVKETISGFTAVIFQHEIDHLEGIIYTDYVD